MNRPRAAFVGFGEINSPRDLIEQKCDTAREALAAIGVDSYAVGPVSDDPGGGGQVAEAIRCLAGERFDAIVLCVAGWIPSHAAMDVIADHLLVPMVLWGLAGRTRGGRLVTTADQAGTSALRKPMADMGITFKYVYDVPDSPPRAGQVASFVSAAAAAAALRRSRVGMMGFRDMRLFATLHDGVSLRGRIGPDIQTFEMLEMVQRADQVGADDVEEVIAHIRNTWRFECPADDAYLRTGCRYYVALRDIVRGRRLDAVSLTDVDGMKNLLNFPPSMILMLISDLLQVPTTPENDAMGCVTQLMVRLLTGQIAAYLEFYEFMEDRVLMGVPDYVPAEVVEGDVVVRPTSFGGFGQCLLNVSHLRTGRVTLCRLSHGVGGYVMHVATGTAVRPRSWEEAGWQPPAPQLPSLEVILDTPVDAFAQNVLGQHYIVAYGEHANSLRDLCSILGVAVY